MNKICKRIFAMTMAITMILSSSVVALAAGSNEMCMSREVENVVVNESSTTDETQIVTMDYVPGTGAEDGIMLLTDYITNRAGVGMADKSKVTDSFTMSRTEKLVIRLRVSGKCHITAKANKGLFSETFLNKDVENGQIWEITNNQLKEGWKVTITLTFSGNSSDYVLDVWGE